MKIIIIGGTGTIGKAVADELNPRHEIIIAGHTSGDIQVDITNPESIKEMYRKIKSFDAVVITAGSVIFKEFINITEGDFHKSFRDKLMGQVNLVLLGKDYINEKGSFTLTSGILNHDPIFTSSIAATVNGAIEGFVKASAIEMPKSLRINCVSPTVITESLPAYGAYFRGYQSVAAKVAALAYSKSAEGLQTGQVYRAGY